ncbi:Glutamate synthase [NADPH] large chain [Marinobacterium lacunae]|uniref:Glutamate synthase [NADPH] large chain n=1 Tax=Marinobacterium lacunae TaxID=1232683 RepID=A0A081G3A3_9GAMM|nr:Glutamate synthase [NADPH] large chain [Marinobacterium lacunae]KEA65258.1 Glutamate synthase [NADPH] large chain [Marinobacterium lacunae]
MAHDHLIISPLVGFYTPDDATSTQGNDDTNTYFQVLAIVPF